MIETNKTDFHLEALHHLANVPFDSKIGVRANKVGILENFGFSKGLNIATKREFELPINIECDSIQTYLSEEIKKGRFVSMLFNGMGWEGSGGSPVVYIMSDNDMDKKLAFNDKKLVRATSQDGTQFDINQRINLQIYSRLKSKEMTLVGFDNYEKPVNIHAGGGFRLQLDNISLSDGQLNFTFSSCFSFNDMGSRVLALSSENDRGIPRYSKNFNVRVTESGLVYKPEEKTTQLELGNVGGLVDELIADLFINDGVAISKLYRNLLSVKPSLKVHQLEGIFSVTDKFGISMEVIDFDGIDTFDLGGQSFCLNPTERLTSAHLKMGNYTSTDSESLLSYIQFKQKVKVGMEEVMNTGAISDEIKNIVKQIVVPESEIIFGNDVLGSIKLARFLKSVGLVFDGVQPFGASKILTQNGEISVVSIEGFDMAFIREKGKLIDCTDIKWHKNLLSKVLGVNLVDAHFSYVHEGD